MEEARRRARGELGGQLTSAVLGTLSQKTSIFILPCVVWSVTDIVGAWPSGSLS